MLTGICAHPLWDDLLDVDRDKEMQLSKPLGSIVRFDVSWAACEQTKGILDAFNMQKLDATFTRLATKGLKGLPTVIQCPQWANQSTDPYVGPRLVEDYGAFCGKLAARYGSNLAGIEVWNEPDLTFKGSTTQYVALVYATKKACVGTFILGGAISGYLPMDYLKACYSAGLALACDALSLHSYADPTFTKLDAARALDSRPVWITETGYPTGNTGWFVSEAQQATNLVRDVAALRTKGVAAVIIYELRNRGTSLADQEQNFGLIRRDFSLKPAYNALMTTTVFSAGDRVSYPRGLLIKHGSIQGTSMVINGAKRWEIWEDGGSVYHIDERTISRL